MKLLSPIKRHNGLNIVIAQKYGETKNNQWYKDHGISTPFHNGLDLLLDGSPQDNYGTELVACFDGQVVKTVFDNPMSTRGNGLTLQSNPIQNEQGEEFIYQAVYWHVSAIITNRNAFKRGECVAYMGNSGTVFPEPSSFCVWCGSHLHFMLFIFKKVEGGYALQNQDNGVGGAVDPTPYIESLQGLSGENTSIEKDLPPIRHFINKLVNYIKNLWH